MLRVCACRPPTLTDSDEQQHECGCRQWSDRLIDFPTVSMKKAPERLCPRGRATTMRGMLMTCCFTLQCETASCTSEHKPEFPLGIRSATLSHGTQLRRFRIQQQTFQELSAVFSGKKKEKKRKESVVGWLSWCTCRPSTVSELLHELR